jgi:hypothetical protein
MMILINININYKGLFMEKKILLLLTFIGIKTLHSSNLNPQNNGDISTCGLTGQYYHRIPTADFMTRCNSIPDGIINYLEAAFNRCVNFNTGPRSQVYLNCYNNYLLNQNQFNEDERHGKPNGEAAKRKKAAQSPYGESWWATKKRSLGLF